ncbi:hypothetical protein GUJ93_ZPchr0010g7613 [Zizania palustris]|uniref:ADF-H domain-containing protein n=1 Tax=Zizania palustris TaxID=103762 RepID=A0A8J5W832_ZIZPA|nr:hypothetical protein GUJ93_ZPchr0010g7613 [Zizania palustris]
MATNYNANLTLKITARTQANAASGMVVDDECKLKFMELMKAKKRTYRFIIYKIDERKIGEPILSYNDFCR